MDKNQIVMLMLIGVFSLTILLTVWLTKRANPEKRFLWFVGCSIVTIFLIGVMQAPISILLSLCLLAFMKTDSDKPVRDIGNGLLFVMGSGLQLSFFVGYLLLGIGGIYWLWVAIQLKSFLMFIIGVIPFALIFTAPIGAYSLLFDTPDWVISWFG